jgi:hypothetical protein
MKDEGPLWRCFPDFILQPLHFCGKEGESPFYDELV